MYGTLRCSVRTDIASYCSDEISEVWRLARNTPSGARRYALGMPAIPNNATTAPQLLCKVDISLHCCSPSVQVMSHVS